METIKSLWQSNLMQLLLAGLISAIVAYLMASWQYRKQYKNGRVMLFEITKRYFIALNETHFVIQDQVKLVEEDLSQELYQNDLQLISEDLRKIFDNPVMIKYFEKYSELTYLTLAINRELVIREDKRRKKVLNPHTFNNFLKLELLDVYLP